MQYFLLKKMAAEDEATGGDSLGALFANNTGSTEAPPSASARDVEIYIVLVMLAVFSFVGTIGNALVVYVFSKKNDSQTSNVFMLALAVVDMVTCMIVLPGTMYMEWTVFYIHNDILCQIYQFLATSNVPYSAFIMTAIAIDRYLCICHPFLHAMTIPRAKVLITCLGILAGTLGFIAAYVHSCSATEIREVCYDTTGFPLYNLTDSELTLTLTNMTSFDHLIPCPLKNESSVNVYRHVHSILRWTGNCGVDIQYWGTTFVTIYKYIHLSTFPLCIVVVSVLYGMIYKSVLDRRRKRAKMKQNTARVLANDQATTMAPEAPDTEETRLATQVTINGDNSTKHTLTVENPKLKRKSTKKDKNRLQNVRTAVMLFIVTVVFVLSFFPACLMVLGVLPVNAPVFNMYFINNAVNPVIYGFMNKAFRDDLKKVFNCQ